MFATYMLLRLEEELANAAAVLPSDLEDDDLGFVAETMMAGVHPRNSNSDCSSNISRPVIGLEID